MTEPKSGLETGVWFNDERCRGYKGTLPVVIQFAKLTPEHITEPIVISRCPPCEWGRIQAAAPGRRVKRWLILPP